MDSTGGEPSTTYMSSSVVRTPWKVFLRIQNDEPSRVFTTIFSAFGWFHYHCSPSVWQNAANCTTCGSPGVVPYKTVLFFTAPLKHYLCPLLERFLAHNVAIKWFDYFGWGSQFLSLFQSCLWTFLCAFSHVPHFTSFSVGTVLILFPFCEIFLTKPIYYWICIIDRLFMGSPYTSVDFKVRWSYSLQLLFCVHIPLNYNQPSIRVSRLQVVLDPDGHSLFSVSRRFTYSQRE